MREWIAIRVQAAAEAPWIIEAQRELRIDQQLEMIMRTQHAGPRHDAQAPRHPEVEDEATALEPQQQVLGATLDSEHALAAQQCVELRRDRPAQAPIVHAGG